MPSSNPWSAPAVQTASRPATVRKELTAKVVSLEVIIRVTLLVAISAADMLGGTMAH